jgi:hypothetical protein
MKFLAAAFFFCLGCSVGVFNADPATYQVNRSFWGSKNRKNQQNFERKKKKLLVG